MNVTNTVIVNNNVNVNVTNVQYVYRRAPGAVMAMQQSAFASAMTSPIGCHCGEAGSDAVGPRSGNGCGGPHQSQL